MKIFKDLSGLYSLAFLFIYINNSIDFQNFEKSSSEDKGTFIHEYCHYLQDVSTTYGYMNFVYLMQDMLFKISKEKDVDDKEVIDENQAYNEFYKGDYEVTDTINWINEIQIKKEPTMEEFYPKGDNEHVIIRYNGDKKFSFGNCCIAESMAYLVERRLYDTKERFDEFPYNVCEKICEFEYSEFAKDKVMIMALCELSLLEKSSGIFFIKALRFMKEKEYIPSDVLEFEKFIKQNFNIGFRGDKKIVEGLLKNIYPMKTQDFLSIITRFELGCLFREKNICFISTILSEENISNRFGFWQQIMEKFGAPNIVDNNGNLVQGAYLNDKEIDIGYMLAPMIINELYDFKGDFKNISCPIIPICKSLTDNSCYDNNCRIEPRKKAKEKLLCPLGMFLRLYNL